MSYSVIFLLITLIGYLDCLLHRERNWEASKGLSLYRFCNSLISQYTEKAFPIESSFEIHSRDTITFALVRILFLFNFFKYRISFEVKYSTSFLRDGKIWKIKVSDMIITITINPMSMVIFTYEVFQLS